MLITTLGTSHGDHTYCRFNSSTLVEVAGRSYLVDAGAPVEALMIRAGKAFAELKAVFVTHMHGDHVFGLPGLIKALIKQGKPGQHTDVFLPEAEALPALESWLQAARLPWPAAFVTLKTTRPGGLWRIRSRNGWRPPSARERSSESKICTWARKKRRTTRGSSAAFPPKASPG